MGVIIKFIIIFLVISYLIRKVGGYFLKLFFGKSAGNNSRSYRHNNDYEQKESKRYGSLRIFKKPNEDKNAEKNFTGGEYVDYEELE